MQKATHTITSTYYTSDMLRELLERRPFLQLDPEVSARIQAGAEYVRAKSQEDRYIYGVNTGFGALCESRISAEQMEQLQQNIIVSHACGIGKIAPEEISRLTMLIKLLTFRTGHTGITLSTVHQLLNFWNHDIIPATPGKGTVGASGDLAPLAHMALPLLGMGEVYLRGQLVPATYALQEQGFSPITLTYKEGLALINGVQYITAIAISCLMDIGDLILCADVIASLSIQAFSASRTFYQAQYHATSHHQDRQKCAANLRLLLEGSNHFALSTCNKSMQDPYSFRCIPQVHGAIRQTYRFAKSVLEDEINSVGDNPLFFPEEDLILFGGNLHGESPALMMDFLSIATSELANISERRTYQLLSGQRGLPSFLVKEPGINSGLMIAQYTSAALVNENKVLATPASVDTIPTSQLQEDHVSMGGTSAYKLRQVVENAEYILAIELLTSIQAIALNVDLSLSPKTDEIVTQFQQIIPFLEKDKILSGDIEQSRQFLRQHQRTWALDFELQ